MPGNLFAYCYGLCYTSGSVALSHTPSDRMGCASAGFKAHKPRLTRPMGCEWHRSLSGLKRVDEKTL